ncbi:flagellar hook capping FlgD N-terminal domain-containing protein [Balneolales bacterium ANBcel1]|nr:flagellar hook capping FlgD N-terminal domain-containing protein [Balneolales bacterium ANBcel1]
MDIHNINSQTSAMFNRQDPAKRNEMGQQQFLQLLVSQMRHQDPLNPLDGADFAAQLAQFNSVEQLINVNQGINKLQESQDMMSTGLTNSLAASLTGKNVKALSDVVMLNSGESSKINYKLNNSASQVDIVIRNESGREIRRESVSNMAGGDHSWEWDGRNEYGNRVPDGNYRVSIEASNEESGVAALTYVEGVASKVRYTGDGVKLTVNGIDIPIGDVEEIGLPL